MKIIAHRGLWSRRSERNSFHAFQEAIDRGFGIETDVRDSGGSIVISHDIPTGNEATLEQFLELYEDCAGSDQYLALNIKADGLAVMLKQSLDKTKKLNVFAFDMAIPDMKGYLDVGIPIFARMSEVETNPSWLDLCQGVWLDSFFSTWYDQQLIADLLASGKKLCAVSPELHQRDKFDLWEMLRPFSASSELILCTDHPEQARKFFKV